MQEPNWGVFSAKFNGKETATFQWLCYLLFCQEFKLPLGVNRYANHAGIESDPIKVGDDFIGWQAKFYTTSLSRHTKELISAIDSAKKNHPELTKIIFYLNKDFGQSKGGSPAKGKGDIEKHAKENGIEITWNNSGFFETPFVSIENATIAKHFFRMDKSVFNLIDELNTHTESILGLIQDRIEFGEEKISLDRKSTLETLVKSTEGHTPVILSGEGGVGKTVVIKKFYDQLKNQAPFFVFKSTEFNRVNINELTKQYGDFTALDLINAFSDTETKYIVFDSAEKLADINDQTVFEEFLTLLLKNKWKIIFTTRRNYLGDLKNVLIDLYHTSFQSIDISLLTEAEVRKLSIAHNFNLPTNTRMLNILCNPFYLNEYLQNYTSIKKDITYTDFKKVLWDKQIARSTIHAKNIHIRRTECFIGLAKKRANEGNFFIKSDGFDQDALSALMKDEIIGYDEDTLGYFIAHDIYEEWALERLIEASFLQFSELIDFYNSIGSSLPIRRAYRSWLSNKLIVDVKSVKALIEKTVSNVQIDSHWRDEALVSVLLSDDIQSFVGVFENNLLKNNAELLIKVTFLLRIACKEVDETMLKLLGIRENSRSALVTLFTKPKGSGWDYIIDFINKHKTELGTHHINSILPVLKDWISKNRSGATTKNASQVALYYYDQFAGHGGFGYGSGSQQLKNGIINSILNGATEIKDELSTIANEVIDNKQTDHRDKYTELVNAMLSSALNSVEVARAIPKEMLKLADLFWTKEMNEDERFSARVGVEESFGITEHRQEYSPSSSFQTPIFMLLKYAPVETLDFILAFTNKCVEAYSKSDLSKNEIQEVVIHLDEDTSIKQYLSDRLWEMYRGTHVSTGLLESMHMALEKWLLEYVKIASKDVPEAMCMYLLKNSKSASISAVVVSVVLANSEELFNVAAVLFKTKEFFLYDSHRLLKDQTQKGTLTMMKDAYSLGNYENELHQNERIQACDESQRSHTLENQALFYQWFQVNDQTKEEVKRRQDIIWAIWDDYYAQLPPKGKETNDDKIWRLYLSRMDSRKMKPTTERKDGKTLISFNPQIDPELKAYSEAGLQESQDAMKHASLMVWASRAWRNEDNVKEYPQYIDKPSVVIEEVKEVLEDFKNASHSVRVFLDRTTPAYACAYLIRDNFDVLTQDEKNFCKDILLEYASLSMRDDYDYQYGDGLDAAINILPLLLGIEQKDDVTIKTILFMTLFNQTSTGSSQHMYGFAAMAILHRLWDIDPSLADSMFSGYLLLAPAHDNLREEVMNTNIANKIYTTTSGQVSSVLAEKYKEDIERVINKRVEFDELVDVDKYEIHILELAFELIPYKTENTSHKKFLDLVLPIFSAKLLDDDEMDYTTAYRFMDKFANFVLTTSSDDIGRYLKPFVDQFSNSRNMGDLLKRFISVQDRLSNYDEFWVVWGIFYDSVVRLSKEVQFRRDAKTIICSYLFATGSWKTEAREWHNFKDKEKNFFEKVSRDMGHHPATIYAISELLEGIGSNFTDDGITWLSDIINNNPNLHTEDLEVNTVYNIENIVRRFALSNRQKLRASQPLKMQVLAILDFIIQKGSVVGYLTREDIL